MPESVQTTRDFARLRIRGNVTTILLTALSVMIVRDMLVRRWGLGRAAVPGMTRPPT